MIWSLFIAASFAFAKGTPVRSSEAEAFVVPNLSKRGGEGADIFARLRPLVFQLKTSLGPQAPKRSYGTAFVVEERGLLITNFHVVSDVVHAPDRFHAYLELPEGPLEVSIESVDVIHDLAVLKAPKKFSGAISLSPVTPRQGERLYSLGMPGDLNISIIEGVYNDVLEYGPYSQIHFSSPLNQGMSGGPTLNSVGELVGVNVAMARFAQNVSFAVPAVHVRGLLGRNRRPSAALGVRQPGPQQLREDIDWSLRKVEKWLTTDLLVAGTTPMSLEGWELPKPPQYLKCWSDDLREGKDAYRGVRQTCYLPQGAYLSHAYTAGTYSLNYLVLSPLALNRLQFAHLVESRYLAISSALGDRTGTEPEDLASGTVCQRDRFRNRWGVELMANYCLSEYFGHPGLVDVAFKWVAPWEGGSALVVHGEIQGVNSRSVQRVFEALWDGVRRKGP